MNILIVEDDDYKYKNMFKDLKVIYFSIVRMEDIRTL